MTNLRVIVGIKKEKPDYFSLYSTTYINTLKSITGKYPSFRDYELDILRKLVWSGVNMMNASGSRANDRKGIVTKLDMMATIKETASGLTPREFQTVFPIEKSYDGEKYEMKDYFYTKEYIKKFGEDKIIGDDITEFLWEYQNRTINFFVMEMMSVASDLRQIDGGKSFMEEFVEDFGLTTYTMTEDHKGKQFLTNNDTGEITKVNKPRPRYLKVVK